MNSEFIEKEWKEISFKQIESKYGQKCSFIDLEDVSLNLDSKHKGLVKQIRDLQTIRNDLRVVKHWLDLLKSSEVSQVVNVEVRNSLWSSILVSYGRCFNSTRGKKLNKKEDKRLNKKEEKIRLNKKSVLKEKTWKKKYMKK